MLGGIQFGSFNNKPETVRDVEVLDIKTRSWKSAKPLSGGSGHHSSVLVPRSWFHGIRGEVLSQKT